MAVKRKKEKVPDLDLVPIMNLVTILIPFLIMAAEFIQLAVIDSSIPPINQNAAPSKEKDEEPFQLTVRVMSTGLKVEGSCAVKTAMGQSCEQQPEPVDPDAKVQRIPDFRCKANGTEIDDCPNPDSYDWQALAEVLKEVKEIANGQEDCRVEEIVIVPDHSVHYGAIVKSMDVVRDGDGLVDIPSEWKRRIADRQPEDGEACNDNEHYDLNGPPVLFPAVVLGGDPITEAG